MMGMGVIAATPESMHRMAAIGSSGAVIWMVKQASIIAESQLRYPVTEQLSL